MPDFDYSFLLYIMFSVLVGISAPYYLFKNARKVSAITIFIAILTILIFFGLRWFDGPHLKPDYKGSLANTTQWPPQINPCPDFLSLKTDNGVYCVDTMGISDLPIFTKTSTKTDQPKNYIPLTKGTVANDYVSNYLLQQRTPITWEGVYDGITASSIVPPFPSA